MAIDEAEVEELLRLKDGHLYHREGQELEFKEQFNFAGLAEYFCDFAAFANNRGGYLIFGVQDSPRIPVGLSDSSLDQFDRIDPERISGSLLDIFSSDIRWDQAIIYTLGIRFGVFRVYEADTKPVISKSDQGRNQEIRNGDIYYRYGGRTQRIQYAELENIITGRIEENNRQWQDLIRKIAQAGPKNAAILDTERSLIEKGNAQILILDEALADKLKFIKSGEFTEEEGEMTLKLVGDVIPVEQVEVVRKVKENRLRRYPLSAMELAEEIKKRLPYVKQYEVWRAIKDNGLKEDPDYSVYNFRNKRQQDKYQAIGYIPSGTPSIYNHDALEFIVRVLSRDEQSS